MLDSRKEVPLRPDFFIVFEPSYVRVRLERRALATPILPSLTFKGDRRRSRKRWWKRRSALAGLSKERGQIPSLRTLSSSTSGSMKTRVIVGVDAVWRQVGRRRQGDEGHGRGVARRKSRPVLRIGLKDSDRRQVETVIV